MLKKIWQFYYDGFRQMTIGKILWTIIIIKLIIIFGILRVCFFKPTLSGSDAEKASQVRQNLVESPTTNHVDN